jgi:hypothetical protein
MMIQIQIGTYELYDYILNSDSNSIKQGEALGPSMRRFATGSSSFMY